MKYKDEFIDIMVKGKKEGLWTNFIDDLNKVEINFYNKKDEIKYSLLFYPDENFIGFTGPEVHILEKDRERFLEILNYKED